MIGSSSMKSRLQELFSNKHFKYGVPFLILIVGSSFGIKHVAQFRYDFRNAKLMTKADEAEYKARGIRLRTPDEVSLENLHKEYMEKDYQDDYEIIRGPRPWEQADPKLLEQQKKLIHKSTIAKTL